MLAIKVDGLKKAYGKNSKQQVIYQNAQFEAKSGELTLIMGASGCGKSSFLRQIALLDPVEQGDICYFSQEVSQKKDGEKAKIRAQQLGFIFQSYALIKEFNILENCALPLLMNGQSKSQAMKNAADYMASFLPDIDLESKPDELSGGEQQRVAIIRALIHQPNIVIADEPTGNLDDTNAIIIKQELSRIAKELGCAVIVVSHDRSFIDCCDAFYSLDPSEEENIKSVLIKQL